MDEMDLAEIRVLLLGFPGVGKFSHQVQFLEHVFRQNYDPALCEFDPQRKQCVVDDEPCILESHFLMSSDETNWMKDKAIKRAHCFMLMFAINSQESFQKLETYWNDVLRTKDVDRVPMIVIGTKVDLESDRTVSEQEINKFCSERGLQYMESSAKTRMNIEESYYDLVRQHRASAHSTKPDNNTRTSNKCVLQ